MELNLSDRTKQLLLAILVGGRTSKQVAEATGIPVNVVTGSLASLKKKELATVDPSGILALTKIGKNLVQPTVVVESVKVRVMDANSKKAKAEPIIAENLGKMKRGELLKLLMDQAQLTYHGANTYLYNYERKLKQVQPSA